MAYKNFRAAVALRVIFLSCLIALAIWLVIKGLFATAVIAFCAIIFSAVELIRYVETTNRDLARFLDAIRYEDFSQVFRRGAVNSSFAELDAAFTKIIQRFRDANFEKEEQFRYLQTVVQHVGIALVAYQKSGEIELSNRAAKRLFGVQTLTNIHALKSFSEEFVRVLMNLKAGERRLVKINRNGENFFLSVYATEFRRGGNSFTLVSIQNIRSELEEQEMEAWQNLIRVLTHEIMNSITPIASLSSTAAGLLEKKNFSEENLFDASRALHTIEKRSEGLLNFVESYRHLTRIPRPNFGITPVKEIFAEIEILIQPQLREKNISFEASVEPDTLELTADAALIEQVLINLVTNSIQALENSSQNSGKKIFLRAGMDGFGRIFLQVCDNGPGIVPEALEQIFIPFFTTKPNGSGIGLSLSRQIMRLHKGSISVQSSPGVETIFTLRF